MPRFTVDVEKHYQGEYWTNRYIVEAPTLAAAVPHGQTIANNEQGMLLVPVTQTRFRVSDLDPATDAYQIVQLNRPGARNANAGDILPLFVVARIDFTTNGGGRPSRKYMRGFLMEGDIQFNAISADIVTAVNAGFVANMLAITAFVDVDGQSFAAGSISPIVGMRQLRRGSKRKAPLSGTPL